MTTKRNTITIHIADLSAAAITLGDNTITVHVPFDVPYAIEEKTVTPMDTTPVVTKPQPRHHTAWHEVEE